MELQKLIALYKQYKNTPKIAGWGRWLGDAGKTQKPICRPEA
jgi:hypothetical protein